MTFFFCFILGQITLISYLQMLSYPEPRIYWRPFFHLAPCSIRSSGVLMISHEHSGRQMIIYWWSDPLTPNLFHTLILHLP
jgi:hypothetical protein